MKNNTDKKSLRNLLFGRSDTSGNHAAKSNKSRQFPHKPSGMKYQLTRAVSVFIIFCLLTISTPAAPRMAAVSLGELHQDVRYSYLANIGSSGILSYLVSSPVFAFFLADNKNKRNKNNKRKLAEISRIEISPKKAAVWEGEQVIFAAVAYDYEDRIVQGADFNWSAVEDRSDAPRLNLAGGAFMPPTHGIFLVTATAENGMSETVKMRAAKDPKFKALKELARIEREGLDLAEVITEESREDKHRLEKDVLDELKRSRSVPVKNSSRMSEADKAELKAWDKREKDKRKIDEQKEREDRERRINQNGKKAVSLKTVETIKSQKKVIENLFGGILDTVRYIHTSDEQMIPAGIGYKFTNKADKKDSDKDLNSKADNKADNKPDNKSDKYKTTAIAGSEKNKSKNKTIKTDPLKSAKTKSKITNKTEKVAGNSPTANHTATAAADPCWFDPFAPGCDYDPPSNPPPASDEWNNGNFNTSDDPGQQPGTPANDGTAGPGSSNFGFSAPVLSIAGRDGLDVNLSLNYNSLLWHKSGSSMIYDIDKGNPAPGWNIGMGKMMDMDTTGGAMLETPDGTRHSYEGTIVSGSSGYSTYYGRTTDGSFIDYIAHRTPTGLSSGTAWLSNGTAIYYTVQNDGVLYPAQIRDRQGNFITITYRNNQGPNINQIRDTLGRIIAFQYDASERLIGITGPGFGNVTRTFVRIHYTQQTLGHQFASGLTAQVRNSAPYQIDAIYYPHTDTGYSFGDTDSYSPYGMIRKIKQVRGMTTSGMTGTDQGTITYAGTMSSETTYNYPTSPNSSLDEAPKYTEKIDNWDGKDAAIGVVKTEYSVDNTSTPRTTTVTLPDGTKSKSYSYNSPNTWNDGMLYQTEFLSPTNAVLNKAVMTWGLGDYNSPRATQIDSYDEKNQKTTQGFTYGAYYNQVAATLEYGYGSSVYRQTEITYENSADYRGTYSGTKWTGGRHIFNLPLVAETKTGGGVRLTRTDYAYDGASLMDTPNVTQHDQTYNPNTTETTNGPCINWEYTDYGNGYGEWYCTAYQQVSVYDPATAKRGNVTQTTVYEKAETLSGAMVYDYTYDITGNNRTATTNCCQQISTNYTLTTQYIYPEAVTRGSSDPNSPDRVTTSAVYDINTGAVASSTDANNRTTTASYDAVTRPTVITLSTGGKSVYEYFDSLLTTRQTAQLANNAIVGQGTSIINGRGQVKISKLLTGKDASTAETATQVQYDIMGRQKKVSNPYPATSAPTNWTEYTYDSQSRVTETTAPDGSMVTTEYNQSAKPYSAATTAGSTLKTQDAWGRQRWARSDAFGRLVEVVEPDPLGTGAITASTLDMATTYTYDELDQLSQINQGVQVRKFKYDSLGRMTRQKLAEQAATINDLGQYVGTGGVWSDSFSYDARSNLTQRTDARGVKTNFSYFKGSSPDPLNRLHAITFDKSQADQPNTIYDSPNISYGYMTTGDKERIQTITSGSVATESYAYDGEGRVSDYTMTAAAKASYPLTTSYLYDTANRLTEVRYPASYGLAGNPRRVANVSYDKTSRLDTLQFNGQTQMNNIAYNDFGQATSISIGAGGSNPLTETYSFNSQTGLMTNQKVQRGATNLMDLSYEYNRGSSNGTLNGTTGQLTHIIDNKDRNKDRVYEFDTLGRLIKAKGGAATGVSATANWTQNYGYDRYGNKTATTSSGYTGSYQAIPLDGLPSQSFDTTSNRINETGYDYDKSGNLIRGKAPNGSWQKYEYDTAGRLRYVRDDTNWIQQSNEYASSRERLASWSYASADITYYAWGGSSVLAEYSTQYSSSVLTWQKSYVYAGSRLLSTITNTSGNEVTEYHHPDRLGTRLISNPTTATQNEQLTLPFGTLIGAETSATNDKRFTSYDRSEIAGGLDYAVNRNYNSGQSRFTQVDPIGMASASIGSPQSLNMFAYVQNNPIDFVDPSGLDGDDLGCGGVGEPGCVVTVTDDYNPFDSDWWRSFARHSAEQSRGGGRGGGSGGSSSSGGGEQTGNCILALVEANKDTKALERAKTSWNILLKVAGGNKALAMIFAAIGIRESGFKNVKEVGGGGGRGIFQIDITQNPGVTEEQALNIEFATNWMNNFLNTQYNRAIAAGTSTVIATGAAIHAYNSGPLVWRGKDLVEKQKRQLKNANDKNDVSLLNKGTTGNNYVTNVRDIAFNCF